MNKLFICSDLSEKNKWKLSFCENIVVFAVILWLYNCFFRHPLLLFSMNPHVGMTTFVTSCLNFVLFVDGWVVLMPINKYNKKIKIKKKWDCTRMVAGYEFIFWAKLFVGVVHSHTNFICKCTTVCTYDPFQCRHHKKNNRGYLKEQL